MGYTLNCEEPQNQLEYVAAQLNGRPRKTLGYRAPAEAFAELLSQHEQPTGVASTD